MDRTTQSRRGRQTGATSSALVPSIVHDVLRSPGKPLDVNTRTHFESRFGRDFSRVRVHADARAASSARAVQASAYTVGQSLVFGEGEYAPETPAGRRLLAHELTHAAQQGTAFASPTLAIGPAHDRHEREAEQVSQRATNGTMSHDVSLARAVLQRQPASTPKADEKKKHPEIKITPSARKIPQSDLDESPPSAPVIAGLPDKSQSSNAKPAGDKSGELETETSYQGSFRDRKITTVIEVGIPITPLVDTIIFHQPFVIAKELKAGVELGPQPTLGPMFQQQVALKLSLKALSYEIESLKSRVKGLKEFGLDITAEATSDPAAGLVRPELALKAELGGSYQIGKTPIFLQGKIDYGVKLPSKGPAEVTPLSGDFGFKFVF